MFKTFNAALLSMLFSTTTMADDLADCKAAGTTLRQDAARSLSACAKRGLPQSSTALGYMYQNGEGVPKDDKMAAQFHEKAAQLGDPWALNNLGSMYADGRGVPQNDVYAYVWLSLAVELSRNPEIHDMAVKNLATVAGRMSSSDIDKAKAQIAAARQKAGQ